MQGASWVWIHNESFYIATPPLISSANTQNDPKGPFY